MNAKWNAKLIGLEISHALFFKLSSIDHIVQTGSFLDLVTILDFTELKQSQIDEVILILIYFYISSQSN